MLIIRHTMGVAPRLTYRSWRSLLVLAVVGTLACSQAIGETAYPVGWGRQMGATGSDWCAAVTVDFAGNAYISGYTPGSLDGSSAGGIDAFVAKYDPAGNRLWVRQHGSSGSDIVLGATSDASGAVYLAGRTDGSLGGAVAGSSDLFLSKYDSDGTRLWTRQLGTSAYDTASSVACGNGGVYVAGYSEGSLSGASAGGSDMVLVKYDPSGNRLWTRQYGSSATDFANSVAVDSSGNAYVTGMTYGSLGAPNAGLREVFVAKYDASGTRLWTQQISSSIGDGYGVATDYAGNVFVTGVTAGNVLGDKVGDQDAFVAKYDPSGNLLWSRQFGTSTAEQGRALAVDQLGNVFVTGYTYGALAGPELSSLDDAFLVKFGPEGDMLWSCQFGTSGGESAWGTDVDDAGNVYVAGNTGRDLFGPNAGPLWASDAFLVRYEAPEPSTIAMLALGAITLAGRRRR